MYLQNTGNPESGRLRQLVPSVGIFFTKLPLERAFYIQDEKRSMSKRRLVSPSFNDIRLILNTAQAMTLGQTGVRLVTFDGDVTLYDDGMSLTTENPVIPRLLELLKRDMYVGIVTAAGYSEKTGEKYMERLKGFIDAVMNSTELTETQKGNVLIMGGEANFLFRLDKDTGTLKWIDPSEWLLPEMEGWIEEDLDKFLDLAETVLKSLKNKLGIQTISQVIRKKRGVGLVPLPGYYLCREQLEEVVLNAQRRLEINEIAQRLQFCAFNGGSDVWVDIGDKRLGVLALQQYLGGVKGSQTLHVGDQFASVGANDFKARLAASTVWIASPRETVEIIDELLLYLDDSEVFHE